MNNLVGKKVLFRHPAKDQFDIVHSHPACEGEVVGVTDDLLNLLVLELSSGFLFIIPMELVRVKVE